MSGHPQAVSIEIGQHVVWHVFGVAFNVDTILGTIVAGLIVLGIGFWVRARVTSKVPSGAQLFLETVVAGVREQVESTMGIRTAPYVVPLAISLFLFIWIANWLSLIPTGHHPEYMPPPASDVNLAYALALLVIVWMHIDGVRKKGFRGFYGHLTKPYVFLTPMNAVEELAKPITLSLRLFGNIFSGVIMVSLIALFPAYLLWAPDIIWKLFDLFIGLIQAFIFALLTILYFGALAPDEEGAH